MCKLYSVYFRGCRVLSFNRLDRAIALKSKIDRETWFNGDTEMAKIKEEII